MPFLLARHSNVAAEVENLTSLQMVMHSSKACPFYTLQAVVIATEKYYL